MGEIEEIILQPEEVGVEGDTIDIKLTIIIIIIFIN